MQLQELKDHIENVLRLRDDDSMDKQYGDSHRYRWEQFKERRDQIVSEALIHMSVDCGHTMDSYRNYSEALLKLYTR